MGAASVPNMVRGLRFPQEGDESQPPEGDQPQPVVTEGWRSEVAPPSASSTEVISEVAPPSASSTEVKSEVAPPSASSTEVISEVAPPSASSTEAVGQAVGQAVSPRSLNDWRSSKAAREETLGSPLQYVGAHRGRSPR
jgi:hypothetical protein